MTSVLGQLEVGGKHSLVRKALQLTAISWSSCISLNQKHGGDTVQEKGKALVKAEKLESSHGRHSGHQNTLWATDGMNNLGNQENI